MLNGTSLLFRILKLDSAYGIMKRRLLSLDIDGGQGDFGRCYRLQQILMGKIINREASSIFVRFNRCNRAR
jgi:hypothetical protein